VHELQGPAIDENSRTGGPPWIERGCLPQLNAAPQGLTYSSDLITETVQSSCEELIG
jgi:hypothetical protein